MRKGAECRNVGGAQGKYKAQKLHLKETKEKKRERNDRRKGGGFAGKERDGDETTKTRSSNIQRGVMGGCLEPKDVGGGKRWGRLESIVVM